MTAIPPIHIQGAPVALRPLLSATRAEPSFPVLGGTVRAFHFCPEPPHAHSFTLAHLIPWSRPNPQALQRIQGGQALRDGLFGNGPPLLKEPLLALLSSPMTGEKLANRRTAVTHTRESVHGDFACE